MQSTGSAFPILERQSQLLAEHLTGTLGAAVARAHARRRRAALPPRAGALGRPRAADDARRLRRLHARAGASSSSAAGARARRRREPARDRHRAPAARSARRSSPRCAARGWQRRRARPRRRRRGRASLACDVTVGRVGGRGGAGGDRAARRRSTRSSTTPASAARRAPGAMPDEHVLKMLDVNLLGAWRVTAAAIDALVQSRGQVVLVGSRMAFLGLPLGAAYGVSKRGLTAYADALRAEYGTHVGVTCVHPAFIRTPIHDRTRAAGLQLEGFSREEPLDGVVAKLVARLRGRAAGATSRSPAAARSSSRSPATSRASSTASSRARCASASPPASSTTRRSPPGCGAGTGRRRERPGARRADRAAARAGDDHVRARAVADAGGLQARARGPARASRSGWRTCCVISPLLGFAIAELYDLDPELAVGLVIMARGARRDDGRAADPPRARRDGAVGDDDRAAARRSPS